MFIPRLLLCLALLLLASCSHVSKTTPSTSLTHSSFLNTSDGKPLSLQHWNLQPDPQRVIIGLHGLQGAARDYQNLGKALPQQAPDTTLYALNLRSAGYDPSPENRGDIRSPNLWKRDLLELHQSLRQRHPDARIFWVGESLGSQIALHTAVDSSVNPDGLILLSPVVSLEAIPRWQVNSLRFAAFLVPGARVSLEDLAGGSVQGTTNSNHFEQSATNPYHVEKHSLRYLSSLAKLAESMKKKASQTKLPTLILYGGKDVLVTDPQISNFAAAFPSPPEVERFPKSHHLLFYDRDKKEVVSRILTWMSQNK